MKYGYFDDDAREYVITDPHTPVKWINYVGSLAFGGLVDHTGGSLLCAGDPALNRIVKYIPQLPAASPKGQWMYLILHRNGTRRIVSPLYVPGLNELDRFACHVGLGYQRIVTELEGVETDVTIFVPHGAPLEVRDIRIRNCGETPVRVELIPVVEFTHFEALKQFTNADWVPQTMMCDASWEAGGQVLLKQYAFMRRENRINFVTSNRPATSFQTDRSVFLGNAEYATWKEPGELKAEKLSNREARRGDVIGAIRHDLGVLSPGAMVRTVWQLGQATPDAVSAVSARYRDEQAVDQAFAEIKDRWTRYLGVLSCETPDPSFTTMVNIHNPRQCFITLNWSRYLSLYQLGLGARGIGFRDTSQDILGAVAHDPERCLDLLRKLLSVQNPDGSAMHQFNPLSMEANEGDAREEGKKLVYGDDHLWVVLAVCAYVKETGDTAFLEEEIPFYLKKTAVPARPKGTVREHLVRALAYTKTHTGAHGLPLLGFADWNDTVNLPGEAESAFVACLYGRALLEMAAMEMYMGRRGQAEAYRADHATMRETFNRVAWDGEWYLRYYTEVGEPIGSRHNQQGRIYTNGQSWPILAGFAPPERARSALEAVNRHLNTGFGIKLSTPGYDRFDPAIGGVSTYPPGAKENGGIFLHANPWVMIAEAMCGNGDRAFQYYQQINPAAKNDIIDRYECEPYCYAQNILGDEHPQFGLGRNSWLSGTASWTYQTATQYILGVRPQMEGLEVNPCLPRNWERVRVRRVFRGATYDITMHNVPPKTSETMRILFNGRQVNDNLLPLAPKESHNEVEVWLGGTPVAPDSPACAPSLV